MTMEQVLQAIKQERGMSALRNGDALVGLFQDFSRNQLRPQANALKVFVSCQGNTRILNLQNAPLQEQQVQLHRLVQEMSIQYNMREEAAVEVCSAFWLVTIGTEYPVPSGHREKRLEKPEQDSKYSGDRIPDIEKKLEKEDQKPVPVPDPPAPKPKSRWNKLGLLFLLIGFILVLFLQLSELFGGDSKRTRSDLAPYNLEDSIEDMLLAGTEEIYTYPDGTWMEFYYDDAGQEIYRVYVNTENDIENLFEARYDDSGRLVYHQSFDGEGNLLRADSYDFHSSEDTAQRRITLGDGRSFQGQSTFDENGYETFTLNHQDGTKTVYAIDTGDHYYDVIPECPIPQKDGHKFLYWANDKGISLRPCDYSYETYTLRCDSTFTAIWQQEIYYSINFDPMGGVMDEGCYTSYPIQNGDYYYQAIPKYPTATKEGYTFKYWWIAEYSYALTADSFFRDYYSIYRDCTFTAVWEKN